MKKKWLPSIIAIILAVILFFGVLPYNALISARAETAGGTESSETVTSSD